MSERTVYQSISRNGVLSAPPNASVHEAACLMAQADCGSLVVLDASDSMVGILTERDLMTKVVAKALDPAKVAVSNVMSGNPRHVSPDTSVTDALLIMKEGGFRHLPILSLENKVVGVFSIRDATPRELSEAGRRQKYLESLGDNVGY